MELSKSSPVIKSLLTQSKVSKNARKTVEDSILKTLIFADIFDFPLTEEEIWKRLISKKKVSRETIKESLKILIREKKIARKEKLFCLWGRKNLFSKRKKREKISRDKKIEALKATNLLKFIPQVKLVAVTGNVAAKNCCLNDDIDLMLVTAPNRLWLTRLIIFALFRIASFFGYPPLRKPKEEKGKDKICLNLFLEEDALVMPEEKRNLFVAYQLLLLSPLLNRNQAYEKLLTSNSFWAQKFLANFFARLTPKLKSQKEYKPPKILVLNLLNKLAFWFQLTYMKSKITREKVGLKFAFFHPQDKRKKILGQFKRRLLQRQNMFKQPN